LFVEVRRNNDGFVVSVEVRESEVARTVVDHRRDGSEFVRSSYLRKYDATYRTLVGAQANVGHFSERRASDGAELSHSDTNSDGKVDSIIEDLARANQFNASAFESLDVSKMQYRLLRDANYDGVFEKEYVQNW